MNEGRNGIVAISCPPPPAQRPLAALTPERSLLAVQSWARAFPGAPVQVSAARRFAAELLKGSALRDDAVIVLSELFTNAVVHTDSGRPGGLVTVQISRWRLGVRVAVTDQGSPSTPVIYAPTASGAPAENGNGLFMVNCLARHLDWHEDTSGRTICAVLGKLPPGHPTLGPVELSRHQPHRPLPPGELQCPWRQIATRAQPG